MYMPTGALKVVQALLGRVVHIVLCCALCLGPVSCMPLVEISAFVFCMDSVRSVGFDMYYASLPILCFVHYLELSNTISLCIRS